MRTMARRVENAGMRVEHFADRPTGFQRRFRRMQRLDASAVHGFQARIDAANAERAHQTRMVMPIHAGEFERQRIVGIEMPAARGIAA